MFKTIFLQIETRGHFYSSHQERWVNDYLRTVKKYYYYIPSALVEAVSVEISKNIFLKIKRRANQEVVLQQSSVHGSIPSHLVLHSSATFRSHTVYFSYFKKDLTPPDLATVAKFNFVFPENYPKSV